MSELNARQRKFVAAYLKDGNATRSAIKAGYSPKAATQVSSRLLRYAHIKAALAQKIKKAEAISDLSVERILQELARIALVDIRRAYDASGNLLPLSEIPEDVARAIAGIEIDELFAGRGAEKVQIGQTRKLKFWDKTRALELAGKYRKMFTDNINHSGTLTLEALLAGTWDEEKKGNP